MKKIPTLFVRDPEDMSRVLPEVHPDCQWVLDGEGEATRKIDGTCMAYLDLGQDPNWTSSGPQWWVRREIKPGKEMPHGFYPVDTDEVTGKTVGWFPAERDGRWTQIQEALRLVDGMSDAGDAAPPTFRIGTYELIGPKINGNPEKYPHHRLVNHDDTERIKVFSLTYEGIRDTCTQVLTRLGWEGIVWHHEDGRMAKIKVRDFKFELKR